MMYWFAVEPDRPEILDVGIRNGLWGVTEDARDEIDVLEPGDFLLFFHRDDGFVLCEVESEPYTERVPVWTEVDFPHRVRISDPVETDRYAHLGEVHDCLLDPESGEPYSSTAKASAALEAAGGTFRPLSDEEIRCLFGRLGWTPPPDVAVPSIDDGEPAEDGEPVEDDEPSAPEGEPPEEDDEEAGEEPPDEAPEEEPPADGDEEPAVAEPVDEGTEPAEEPEEEGSADAGEPPAEGVPDEEVEATAPRVILAPAAGNEASRLRWEETVEEGVPVDRLEGHLPDDELEAVREASEAGRIRVWGTAPARDEGSRAQWSDSGPGDVLLFTGGGEIFASARVVAKRRDPDLAEELWGRRDDGDTWEFLFFATEPLRQGVPYEAFNEVAGYEAGYRIPRLNILETERSLRILGAFPEFALVPREGEDDAAEAPAKAEPAADAGDDGAGAPAEGEAAAEDGDAEGEASVEADEEPAEAIEADGPAEDAAEEAAAEDRAVEPAEGAAEADGPAEADEPGETPDETPAAAPAADGAPDDEEDRTPGAGAAADAGVGPMDGDRLRTLLFGRRELGRCAICGRLLPVELLDVVYVKPLEACDPDELEDVGNDVFPGCRLGCAGLFRQGYLVVEEGVVRPGREEPLTEPAQELIEEIVGNRCEYWHSGSEPYFRWHAARSRDR
jgi:hypothetical protein